MVISQKEGPGTNHVGSSLKTSQRQSALKLPESSSVGGNRLAAGSVHWELWVNILVSAVMAALISWESVAKRYYSNHSIHRTNNVFCSGKF
ncbi:hypothetical protein ElyMa_000630900 [Elysia marginata]|uniref:Uncharacterized protein n=1 Tax=Elysia marginata TaxID=1093978 RepID=A0AAV4GC28_9GAST|nr:hypothetical protein ElyMa_000630900 [Elysia marginata]